MEILHSNVNFTNIVQSQQKQIRVSSTFISHISWTANSHFSTCILSNEFEASIQ